MDISLQAIGSATLPEPAFASQYVQAESVLRPQAVAAGTPNATTAFQGNTLGVGFSGSGFLVVYFVGVTAILRSLGVINNTTRLAGSSGGSVAAAMSCGDMPTKAFFSSVAALANTCRAPLPLPRNINCNGTLDATLKGGLLTTLPLDVAARCNGRLFVSVTRAAINPGLDTEVKVTNFNARDQVLSALAASSYIPRVSGPDALTRPSNIGVTVGYDGVGANPLPVPPAISGVTYSISVSAIANGTNPPTFSNLIASANSRPPTLAEILINDTRYLPLNPTVVPQPASVDIYPGLSGALPSGFTAQTWNNYVLTAPDTVGANSALKKIFDTGRKDALAWVAANLPSISAAQRQLANSTTNCVVNLLGVVTGC